MDVHASAEAHPAALVPVTVYVVFEVGDTTILAPVNEPGIQVYVEAPLAVNVTDEPRHTEADELLTVTVGYGFTVSTPLI